MSSIIDPFAALPEADRARTRKIYGVLRQELDAWIEERVAALGEHVTQEALLKSNILRTQIQMRLDDSIQLAEEQLDRIRTSWAAISGAALASNAAATAELERAVRALEDDVKKRRDEMRTWGKNLADIVATAAKAAVTA